MEGASEFDWAGAIQGWVLAVIMLRSAFVEAVGSLARAAAAVAGQRVWRHQAQAATPIRDRAGDRLLQGRRSPRPPLSQRSRRRRHKRHLRCGRPLEWLTGLLRLFLIAILGLVRIQSKFNPAD